MRILRLVVIFSIFALRINAEEISSDLYASLNPPVYVDEQKAARQIRVQFRGERLKSVLMNYLIEDHSAKSKNIAAEVVVQLTEFDEGDRGLFEMTKHASRLLVRRSANRIIQKLSKLSEQNVPKIYTSLSTSQKRDLMHLILNQAQSYNVLQVASASAKLASLSDALLILQTYNKSTYGKAAAALSIAQMAESESGELGLARLAVRSDVERDFSMAALKRIKGILSGYSGRLTKLKLLERFEKEKLVHSLLSTVTESDRVQTSENLLFLNRNHDLEEILRSYRSSKVGLELAAEAVVRMKTVDKADSVVENALVVLSRDENPYIRNLAVKRIKSRISAKRELSVTFRLLDPDSKDRLTRLLMESSSKNERASLLQKLSQDPKGLASIE